MKKYVALLHHDIDSGAWGIMFPDFPGCVSAGDSYEAALRSGTEALAAHVAWMQKDHDEIPEPRTVDEIKASDEEWIERGAAAVAYVTLPRNTK